LSLFFNDVDLCLRLWRKGRRIRYLAEVEVMHHHGLSTRSQTPRHRNLLWTRNRMIYYRKNHGRLAKPWLRAVLGLWALECKLRIHLGSRAASAKQAALAELNEFLKECVRAT
jgi:GT2 family glycosyltransferase